VLRESNCVCDYITWGRTILTRQRNNETVVLLRNNSIVDAIR